MALRKGFADQADICREELKKIMTRDPESMRYWAKQIGMSAAGLKLFVIDNNVPALKTLSKLRKFIESKKEILEK